MSKLHSLLTFSVLYSFLQRILGAEHFRSVVTKDHLSFYAEKRILDVGCGPADILKHLQAKNYIGIDSSSNYIQAARQRYGKRAQFHCASFEAIESLSLGRFDLILAIGFLHHICDEDVKKFFQICRAHLKPNGRILTIDPSLERTPNRFARFLIKRDRGTYVRDQDHLVAIAKESFPNTRASLRHDLLYVPYTHLFLESSSGERTSKSS